MSGKLIALIPIGKSLIACEAKAKKKGLCARHANTSSLSGVTDITSKIGIKY
jgi:hypothetical protein